jgi:hypothetical protein
LSPARLSRVASAAFGCRWQADLARSMGVERRTVVAWASGACPVSAKSEAIIVELCVARAKANLAEALKVRRELKVNAKQRAAYVPRPPSGKGWHEARGLPQPPPKPAKPPHRRKMFDKMKPRAKRAPSEKQLAYWRSEAVRENGRKGLAKAVAKRREANPSSQPCPPESAQPTTTSADAPIEPKS